MITKISEHQNMDFLIIHVYTAHSIQIFLHFQVFYLHYLWSLYSLGIDMLCKHIICRRRIVRISFVGMVNYAYLYTTHSIQIFLYSKVFCLHYPWSLSSLAYYLSMIPGLFFYCLSILSQ